MHPVSSGVRPLPSPPHPTPPHGLGRSPAAPRPRTVCCGSAGARGGDRRKRRARQRRGGGGACLACQRESRSAACEPGARAATALRPSLAGHTRGAGAPLGARGRSSADSPPPVRPARSPTSGPGSRRLLRQRRRKERLLCRGCSARERQQVVRAPRTRERRWPPPAGHVSKALAAPRAWAALLSLRAPSSPPPELGCSRAPDFLSLAARWPLAACRVRSWRLPPGGAAFPSLSLPSPGGRLENAPLHPFGLREHCVFRVQGGRGHGRGLTMGLSGRDALPQLEMRALLPRCRPALVFPSLMAQTDQLQPLTLTAVDKI